MHNNILRTEKVKSRAQITEAAEHNFRLRQQANINSANTHLNKILVNSLDVDVTKASDLQKKLTVFYKELGIKERSDNVLMMEFVVSASPEFFENKTPAQIEFWAKHQVDFFQKKFPGQIKIAVLHLDEKTPHLHFMIGTEMKSVKKYKNQKGEFFKETWSLNADRYNPKFLVDLHTEHAKHNEKFGLKRGVKGSMRNHTSLKEFYSIVDKALSADYGKQIERSIESLQTGLLTGKVSIEEVREKFKPTLNKLLKQNKVLKEKFALDIKKWAEDLAKKESELNEALKNAHELRDLYIEAINEKKHDTALLAEQKKELADKQKEITRLKEKYEPATKINQVREKTMTPIFK
jgi:Plasmid recombination enzyme